MDVELGDLFLVLDVVFGNDGAIDTVVHAHRMKGIAANGTGVCLLSPGANAGIVDDVVAPVKGGDNIEVAGVFVVDVDVDVELDNLGGGSGGYRDGVTNTTTMMVVEGRGTRKGIQAYNALLRFRHDVEFDSTDWLLMETCKKNREGI